MQIFKAADVRLLGNETDHRVGKEADENSKELANNFEHLSNNLKKILFTQSKKNLLCSFAFTKDCHSVFYRIKYLMHN